VAIVEREVPAEPMFEPARLHGLMAEFDTAEELLRATRRARSAGYRHMDAYTPFPVEGLSDALDFHTRAVPLICLFGGLAGLLTATGMQYGIHVFLLPINVGGRPLDSWPSFVPVMFELTVLFAALSMLVGLLILNGLPQPYHPVFNVAAFAQASRDRFFLCIEASDPSFDAAATRRLLEELAAREVRDVPE
jgi:hypothetical protein